MGRHLSGVDNSQVSFAEFPISSWAHPHAHGLSLAPTSHKKNVKRPAPGGSQVLGVGAKAARRESSSMTPRCLGALECDCLREPASPGKRWRALIWMQACSSRVYAPALVDFSWVTGASGKPRKATDPLSAHYCCESFEEALGPLELNCGLLGLPGKQILTCVVS